MQRAKRVQMYNIFMNSEMDVLYEIGNGKVWRLESVPAHLPHKSSDYRNGRPLVR